MRFKQEQFSRIGTRSAWSDVTTHTVLGQILPPLDPTNFASVPRLDGTELSWEHPGGLFATTVFFELRLGSDWDTAIFIDELRDRFDYFFDIEDAEEKNILLRARNEAGIYSVATLEIQATALRPDDVFGFQATAVGDDVQFSWNPVDGSNIVYEIRQGESWEQAGFLLETGNTFATILFPTNETRDYTFFIKKQEVHLADIAKTHHFSQFS